MNIRYHHHLSLNREGCWDATDDFTPSFLHFSVFSTALWDLANSRPGHSLMLSSHLFLCLPCLLPPFTVPCKMVLAPDLMNGRHEHTTAIRVSLRSSEGLLEVRLPFVPQLIWQLEVFHRHTRPTSSSTYNFESFLRTNEQTKQTIRQN